MAQTCESLKAMILEMPVNEASTAILQAVEEWPELYDMLVEGMEFEELVEGSGGDDNDEDGDDTDDDDDEEDED